MTRRELFSLLPDIITGYDCVTYSLDNHKFFYINVRGCIYPSEIDDLRKYCYVSSINFDILKNCFEISCTDLKH